MIEMMFKMMKTMMGGDESECGPMEMMSKMMDVDDAPHDDGNDAQVLKNDAP